jgi:glycosyltransferase involved in cell wall biosynthesis
MKDNAVQLTTNKVPCANDAPRQTAQNAKESHAPAGQQPTGNSAARFVSVIIPTLNRARRLEKTLRSLVTLDYPSEHFEVLIVDNGSTDDTPDVAERIRATHPEAGIRYMFEPTPGSTAARHRGAKEARGDILVFTDDDIEASPGWLASIGNVLQDPSVHMVGGRSLPRFETVPPDWVGTFRNSVNCIRNAWFIGYLSLLDLGEYPLDVNPRYIWSLNLAIRRQTLFDLGGFNPDLVPKHLQRYQGNGETGLSIKVNQNELKAMYHPGVLVHHVVSRDRLTIEYFEKRAYFQGVADSYTRIRERGGLAPVVRDWRAPIRGTMSAMRCLLGQRRSAPAPYADIRERVSKAHRRGYEFHQSEVRNDPELLKWVLRSNYWDCGLPDMGRRSESTRSNGPAKEDSNGRD